MINVVINNALARIVGLIAVKHPEYSVQVEWREGSPEREWFITASDGVSDVVYIADDESGTWAPLNETELALYARGETVIGGVAPAREP